MGSMVYRAGINPTDRHGQLYAVVSVPLSVPLSVLVRALSVGFVNKNNGTDKARTKHGHEELQARTNKMRLGRIVRAPRRYGQYSQL